MKSRVDILSLSIRRMGEMKCICSRLLNFNGYVLDHYICLIKDDNRHEISTKKQQVSR